MYTGHVFWIFFEKSQNDLVWPFLMFLAVLTKKRRFSNIGDTLANSRITRVLRTSLCLRVIELLKKPFVRTSHRLYLGPQSRSIEINRDQSRSIFGQKHSSWPYEKKMPRDWGTSEVLETSILELLTRRIQICGDQAPLPLFVKLFFKNTQKTKMELGPPQIWILPTESFSYVVSDPWYIALSVSRQINF